MKSEKLAQYIRRRRKKEKFKVISKGKFKLNKKGKWGYVKQLNEIFRS